MDTDQTARDRARRQTNAFVVEYGLALRTRRLREQQSSLSTVVLGTVILIVLTALMLMRR
jgi:hypothetical protein